MRTKTNVLKNIIIISSAYLTICLLIMPQSSISAAKAALALCSDTVIPSLFPFFVCSGLFISMGVADEAAKRLSGVMRPLFGTGGAGAVALILGIVSGYPVGAKCAADLYDSRLITRGEAERLCAFCNNSGPLFIVGAVGTSMLGSAQAGMLLYVSHIISALAVGILFGQAANHRKASAELTSFSKKLKPRFSNGSRKKAELTRGRHIKAEPTPAAEPHRTEQIPSVADSVYSGVQSILKVCGFVIIFAVLCAAIPEFQGREFLFALLEITNGCRALISLNLSGALLPVLSFFIALSGLSVLLQVMGVISHCGLSVRPYIFGKLLQGIISAAVTFALMRLFPITVPTSNIAAPIVSSNPLMLSVSVCAWTFVGILTLIIIAGKKDE